MIVERTQERRAHGRHPDPRPARVSRPAPHPHPRSRPGDDALLRLVRQPDPGDPSASVRPCVRASVPLCVCAPVRLCLRARGASTRSSPSRARRSPPGARRPLQHPATPLAGPEHPPRTQVPHPPSDRNRPAASLTRRRPARIFGSVEASSFCEATLRVKPSSVLSALAVGPLSVVRASLPLCQYE